VIPGPLDLMMQEQDEERTTEEEILEIRGMCQQHSGPTQKLTIVPAMCSEEIKATLYDVLSVM
jgi:hypothetical protein